MNEKFEIMFPNLAERKLRLRAFVREPDSIEKESKID
jgi:hypothetical protein